MTVHGATTLAEVFQLLTGDAQQERLLQQHAKRVHDQWDAIRSAGPSSDQELRDENETHRLDCYTSPSYRIERPRTPENPADGARRRQPDQQSSDDDVAAPDEHDSAQVPGDGDDSLLNLLSLLKKTTVWDDAPDWLAEAQEPAPRWLTVYDNAGAGKTVFTFRAAHVATSPAARKRRLRRLLAAGGPLGRPLAARGARCALGERSACTAGLPGHGLALDDAEEIGKARKLAQYALDKRRVVIILDGFDQFSPEDRSHVVEMLKRDGRSDGDAKHCSWIVASRVHTIDELRASVFLDSRFALVRIDPFTPQQQDAYFAVEAHDGRAIGRRWLRTIGVTDNTGDEKAKEIRQRMDELLRLPMTLSLVRKLIEMTPDTDPLPVFQTLSELALTVSRRLLGAGAGKERQGGRGRPPTGANHRPRTRRPPASSACWSTS